MPLVIFVQSIAVASEGAVLDVGLWVTSLPAASTTSDRVANNVSILTAGDEKEIARS